MIEAKFPLGLLNRQEKKIICLNLTMNRRCTEELIGEKALQRALTPASQPAGLAAAAGHHFASLLLFDSSGCWVVFKNRSK